MLDSSQSWSLFGYDVRQIGHTYRAGWRDFLWGPTSTVRQSLDEPVTMHEAGSTYTFKGGEQVATVETQAEAVMLPDELVLSRELTLPLAAQSNLDAVLAMEVAANSPFPADDTVYGWTLGEPRGDSLVVVLVLCARSSVMEYIASQFDSHERTAYEVWARASNQAVMVQGFGEAGRGERYRKKLVRMGLALAYCMGMLVVCMALSTGFKYLELRKTEEAFEGAKQTAARAVSLRNRLATANETIERANSLLSAHPDVYNELSAISRLLDDNTFLTQVDVRPGSIRIDGQSPNASAVMQQLTDAANYDGVKATVGIRKVGRDGMERFVFELTLPEEARPVETGS